MHRVLALVLALMGGVATGAAPVWVTPKHRAAPPEQMLPGGPLAPVSPSDVPLWSRGSMLRVELDAEGSWRGQIPIDAAGNLRVVPISHAGDDLTVTFDGGVGDEFIRLAPDTRSAIAQTTEVPGVGAFTGYVTAMPRAGLWDVSVDAPVGTPVAYLAMASDGAALLRSWRETDRSVVGSAISYSASVHATRAADPMHGMSMAMLGTTPAGHRIDIEMAANAGGVASASFTPGEPGRYLVQIVARNDSILRTAEHILHVLPAGVSLGDRAAARAVGDGSTLRIGVPVDAQEWGGHCRLTAQVWGRDDRGNAIPLCWVGGMTVVHHRSDDQSVLPVDLDARWIGTSAASGSFELRHVEVRCPRTMVLLAGAESMQLDVLAPVQRLEGPGTRSGSAPRSDERSVAVDVLVPAVPRVPGGHNLLLVHGYCAGGNPWPVGDFSGAIEVFSDPESNRSHDEFALLLKALADTTKSSGVVAHSQGGCAALHLSTYYFSALDWAEGGRLIQSVGTPYQGTPLAGNLALLGDLFGSGCGENTDLSVAGAAAWLSGIPSDARSRVHYWTTSSSGPWCNFFSGLILSNPEDGVIEVSRGQLPGATNMGNTVGQCHTTGMSNPPQYQDAVRNSEMNANAAR